MKPGKAFDRWKESCNRSSFRKEGSHIQRSQVGSFSFGAVLLGASLIRQRETQRQKREGTKNHESLEKGPQVNKRNVRL